MAQRKVATSACERQQWHTRIAEGFSKSRYSGLLTVVVASSTSAYAAAVVTIDGCDGGGDITVVLLAMMPCL